MAMRKYHIGNCLGEGAYGTVFEVTDVTSNESYALKKIAMKSTDDGVSQAVLREISSLLVLKQLGSHPNVLKLFDAFVSNSEKSGCFANIIYEKCDWDLQDFLTRIPSDMPDGQCRLFAQQIFAGLDFLHSNSIIHRDLKPQNILVNRDQSVKIADFGLSRIYGLHSTFTTVAVTLNYRSPELLLQCKYNTSVDIWSAGCILVELYTRKPLFVAETEAQQMLAIFRRIGAPPAEAWPSDAIIDYSFCISISPISLKTFCPRAPDNAIELANEILQFNPHQRPTAAECLQRPYFA